MSQKKQIIGIYPDSPKQKPRITASPIKAAATKMVSFRLTDIDHTKLMRRVHAAQTSTTDYIIGCLFDDDAQPRKRKDKVIIGDRKIFARIFSLLGASRIASNLNQIAKSLNQGLLHLSPEMEANLREACDAIIEIRDLLLEVLGKRKH